MPALNPNIIRDTRKLISLYQTSLNFRAAFDRVTAKNINTTYLGRPIKLYVEVLANISSGYKADYAQVRKIVLQDTDRKVGELFAKVKPHDFFLLDSAAKSAQQGLNYSSYSAEEIKQINNIETVAKDRKEKREAYAKREIATPPTPQTPQLPPTPSLTTAGNWSAKVGSFFRKGAGGTAEKAVAGKAAAVSAGKIAAKLGINTVVKAGAGFLAKLGISALTGAATAGVGLVVGVALTLATTFGEQIKKLFKYIMLIVIALFLILFVSSSNQRGIKMNAFLPPYALPLGGNVGIGTSGVTPPPTGGGDIASCFFYRGGETSKPGFKLGNPAMAALISDISSKVGVPAAIITGIMRVESPNAFASTDPSYVTNDYEAKSSGVAFGLMQFTVGTFISTYENNQVSMNLLFNKTSQTTTIDPQDKMQPDTVLRIYSIRDSLIAASYKVKADKQAINGSGSWDENTIKQIAARYYGTNADGTTNYKGDDGSIQNYGNDLWKSYSECQSTIIPPTPPLSPSPGPAAFNSYFCQSNPAWASSLIGSSGETMSSGGCGLTSVAMVLNYFGLSYTPTEILVKFNQNPSWYTPAGANMGLTLGWVESLGFEIVELNPDASALERDIPRYLNSGYLILGSQYIASPLSHIFVVSDSLPNGNVILQDPDKNCQPNLEKTITRIMDNYSRPTYGRWMYAKAIKKVR